MYMPLRCKTTTFAAIGGSRSLGMETVRSDTDLIIMASTPDYSLRMKGCYNTLYKSPNDFYEMLTLPARNYIHVFQFLYPERFMTDNEFTNWIAVNRDALMDENKVVFYSDALHFLEDVQQHLPGYFKVAGKRISHAVAYGKISIAYASGCSMSDCFKATGDWREALLKIRNKELSYEVVQGLVEQELSAVTRLCERTVEPTQKPNTTQLKEMLDATYFEDYAKHL